MHSLYNLLPELATIAQLATIAALFVVIEGVRVAKRSARKDAAE